MQNYGVIAEISDAAFYDAVNHADINELFQQKKQENYMILESMEIKNVEKYILKSANP